MDNSPHLCSDLYSSHSLRASCQQTLKKQEQSTSIVDPLAYVAHTTHAPALSSPSTPSPQPTAQSPNDALMATMTQIANLLSGFQKQFPPTNNQLRTSSNSRTHATVHDGHIGEGHVARQCKEPKRKMDSQYFKDKALLMEAKEKGDVLDTEAEAFSLKEHTKVLELEAEVLKQQKMVIESEKRNSHLQKTHIDLQLKFQNYKQCIDTSSASNCPLKQLYQQHLNTDRIQLKDTITSLRIQLDGLKVENVSQKRRYDELSKANTHSRTVYTEKINALTTENAKLKTELSGKKTSGSTAFEKPKVLASDVTNITKNHNVNTTKTAWRPTGKVVGSVKPQWKPTGRHFALYDNCPLTRIMEPIVEPLELPRGVKFSRFERYNISTGFTDCKLSDRKAGSKGSKGRTVADSIAERLTRPTAYKFKTDCSIIPVWGNDLLTGIRGSDLYTISLQETTSSTPICLMAKASPTQAWLWHQRLSHLNFDYINLLSKKDVVIGLPKMKYVKDQVCSSCEVSKAKRSSFKSKTVPSSKGRLNLLHMDLCGPMRVASINGKKYILVIVDDYSRYTWTLFLRSKDETPEVLKDFLTMIQRNLQAPVISVRTDRGTEFLNKTLNAFFKEEGIEHQTSTP
ncbi:retrovirus-related pol polyprotein from transposon TNT 1-94 [Tanacetum coccineum]